VATRMLVEARHGSAPLGKVRSCWRRSADRYELIQPPVLPEPPSPAANATCDSEKLASFQTSRDAVSVQKEWGIQGSRAQSREALHETLTLAGSTRAEGVAPSLMPIVFGLCHKLMSDHTSRLLADPRWCDAFAAAAEAVVAEVTVKHLKDHPRICVLGLGSAVPALAAARAGAEVVWVERVERFAQCAERLAARNGLEARVRVARCRQWRHFQPASPAQRFDALITEEISDNVLGDGILDLARHARSSLLLPGGRFLPARLRVSAALLSVRTTAVAGFDLRAFNAFRAAGHVWHDYDHLRASDVFGAQRPQLLSDPVHLWEIDLEKPLESLPELERQVLASRAGILNCVCFWAEVIFSPGGAGEAGGAAVAEADKAVDEWPLVSLGPCEPPLAFCRRARRQHLRLLGYERVLVAGEVVTVLASAQRTRSGQASCGDRAPVTPVPAPLPKGALSDCIWVDAPAELCRSGRLRHWPRAPCLAYHFPMISDEGRNRCFDVALRAAVAKLSREQGRSPHVLDIGSGSGLLAMMAARAGASKVSSLEMVPALAAAARQIVASNGYKETVTIFDASSHEVDEESLGSNADLLVCEIVDDMLLGEGVLATVADARRRLLRPGAPILPRGGSLFALAVELKVPNRSGFDLDELSLFNCDQGLAPRATDGIKLQELSPTDYRILAAPVLLFRFDWAEAPVDEICQVRHVTLPLRISSSGTLTAFLVYFHLHLDHEPENDFSSGPENKRLVAWDQSVRYLPMHVEVTKGQVLQVAASHDAQTTRIGLTQLSPSMLGHIGHIPPVPVA